MAPPGAPRSGWFSGFLTWLFKTRNGYLAIWCLLGMGALVAALWINVFGPTPGMLNSAESKTAFVGASAVVLLPVLLFFLNAKDNLQSGPGLLLPVLSLGLLVALTGIVVQNAIFGGASLFGTGLLPDTRAQLAARMALFVFLAVAFIPNIWNAAIFAEFEEQKRDRIARSKAKEGELGPDDESEAISALVSTAVVVVIAVLAYIAGGVGSSLAFENFYGLVLCGAVIGVFGIVVFIDTLAETEFIQALGRGTGSLARRTKFLASFYNWVDTGFVRIGASVAGMGHETTLRRYGLLAGTLTCLTLLAWFLPPPLGLVPAGLGFVIAISVSRLWSWVEEDRALAAMTEYRYDAPYRVGFREDYRDETLLGFMFVFTLLPITMMQLHVGQVFGPNLFAGATGKTYLEWFGFFGVELAKAVPIIDWAEIYSINPANDLIKFESAAAKHTVFLARAMVDLVLIASLLQALGVATRNRNQKRLFAAGHITRLDELVERSELLKAVRSARLGDKGIGEESLKPASAREAFDLKGLGRHGTVNFRKYDESRLRHLYWALSDLETRAFIAALSADSDRFPLSSAIDQTKEIAAGNKNEVDMFAAFQRALAEHRAAVNEIDVDDLYEILTSLRAPSGLKDFKYSLIDLMVEIGPASAVVDKLTGLAGGANPDGYQYTRRKIAAVIAALAPSVGDREVLREALLEWESWPEDSRPGGGYYEIAVTALRNAVVSQR